MCRETVTAFSPAFGILLAVALTPRALAEEPAERANEPNERAQLRGTVTDESGAPAADAQVSLFPLRYTRDRSSRARSTKVTSAEGTFETAPPVTSTAVQVYSADHKLGALLMIDSKTTKIDIRLKKLADAHGRLVDSLGAPVEGATLIYRVRLAVTPRFSIGAMSGVAKTAADGSFTLKELLPGEPYELCATADEESHEVNVSTLKLDNAKTIELGATPLPRLAQVATLRTPQRKRKPWPVGAKVAGRKVMELNLAETEPRDGLIEAVLKGSTKKYYLSPEVLVTNLDFQGTVSGPTSAIAIELKPVAMRKVVAALSGHVGQPVAIVAGGELILVVEPQVTPRGIVLPNLSACEQVYMSSLLRSAWEPAPDQNGELPNGK